MVNGEWQDATQVGNLGQQWELAKINPYDGSPIPVKVCITILSVSCTP